MVNLYHRIDILYDDSTGCKKAGDKDFLQKQT